LSLRCCLIWEALQRPSAIWGVQFSFTSFI
jgi:hypothetical protein